MARGRETKGPDLGPSGSGVTYQELLREIEFLLVPGLSVGPDLHLSPQGSLKQSNTISQRVAEGWWYKAQNPLHGPLSTLLLCPVPNQ